MYYDTYLYDLKTHAHYTFYFNRFFNIPTFVNLLNLIMDFIDFNFYQTYSLTSKDIVENR